jgi:hypothetical protein
MVDVSILPHHTVRDLLGFFEAQIEDITLLVVIYPYVMRWEPQE